MRWTRLLASFKTSLYLSKMAKGRASTKWLNSTGQDLQAANRRGGARSSDGGRSEELGNTERSPLRASRVGGGVGSPCVGEGRGVGARVTGVEFPDSRSADARIELGAPSSVVVPLSSPSPTCACVEEGVGKEARADGEEARAGERFADARSADAGSADAATRGAGDGRLASH